MNPQEFAAWHIGTFPNLPETTVAHWLDREPGYVYIGRKGGGTFGNPFHAPFDGDRKFIIELYRLWFHRHMEIDPEFREAVHALRGKQLVCHCKPLDCHGDVIAEYLNSL